MALTLPVEAIFLSRVLYPRFYIFPGEYAKASIEGADEGWTLYLPT